MRAPNHLAVVLGTYETGLAVGRSLGRAGIRVLGLDVTRKLGFYSRYMRCSICPHPADDEPAFLDLLEQVARNEQRKPVLFITSDDFVLSISRNRERLTSSYLLDLPSPDVIESISDKYAQTQLASGAGVGVPLTFTADTKDEVLRIRDRVPLPAFIKAREVTSWRKAMGPVQKGFVATTREDLVARLHAILDMGAVGLAQELIPGPDTAHYKVCVYISRSGEPLLTFALQKIRQCPPGFGFGCVVQSVYYPRLIELGIDFLKAIGYRGVASAEFKLDSRDGELKLIELNPRYWQQNSLADRCGMNFPLCHYLDLTERPPEPITAYLEGVKWINIRRDFDAFRGYRRRGQLSVSGWLHSLKGPGLLSDIAWDDFRPGIHALLSEAAARRRGLVRRLKARGRTDDDGS